MWQNSTEAGVIL